MGSDKGSQQLRFLPFHTILLAQEDPNPGFFLHQQVASLASRQGRTPCPPVARNPIQLTGLSAREHTVPVWELQSSNWGSRPQESMVHSPAGSPNSAEGPLSPWSTWESSKSPVCSTGWALPDKNQEQNYYTYFL